MPVDGHYYWVRLGGGPWRPARCLIRDDRVFWQIFDRLPMPREEADAESGPGIPEPGNGDLRDMREDGG